MIPLRGGLIGCGFVSRHHLEGWSRIPEARLVAVCDLDPERLAAGHQLAPGARPYRSAATMLESENLDFIEICTRPESHRGLVELAARHGVHVLCQKPAAPDRDDLEAMIAACDHAGVRLMIHENWRFRPWNRALRDAVQSGRIGRPIRLRLAHRDTRALDPGGFRDQPYFARMPRLIVYEMGPHLVDTSRLIMGEVDSVAASMGRFGPDHDGDDVATLLLRFQSGALGLLDLSWCSPADKARPLWALNETVVEGTEATIQLQEDGSLLRIDCQGNVTRQAVPLPDSDQVYLDGYIATQRHFLNGLLHGLPHETSGTETRKTMNVVWAAYESARSGQFIKP